MNGKSVEEIADMAVERVKLAAELLDDQYEGMGPGLSEPDDTTFYGLCLQRMGEYGPDFMRALDAKKPDGTDLVPGGRNVVRKFLRIKAQRMYQDQMMRTGSAWNPEPYEVSDAARS